MNSKHISIFNLIKLFTHSNKKPVRTINLKTHCEQKYIHDFYCDAEKPFIN